MVRLSRQSRFQWILSTGIFDYPISTQPDVQDTRAFDRNRDARPDCRYYPEPVRRSYLTYGRYGYIRIGKRVLRNAAVVAFVITTE